MNVELKKAYDAPQQTLIDELTSLLEKQPSTTAAIDEFQTKLAQLLKSERPDPKWITSSPTMLKARSATLSPDEWRELLDVLGTRAMREGGLERRRCRIRRSVQEIVERCQRCVAHRYVLADEAARGRRRPRRPGPRRSCGSLRTRRRRACTCSVIHSARAWWRSRLPACPRR